MKIRKPSYSKQLKMPEWAAKRFKILKRDKFKCCKCGSNSLLQVHHKKYIDGKMAWEVPDRYLETLCNGCHKEIHKTRKIKTFVIKEKTLKKIKLLSKNERRINKMVDGLSSKDRMIHNQYLILKNK